MSSSIKQAFVFGSFFLTIFLALPKTLSYAESHAKEDRSNGLSVEAFPGHSYITNYPSKWLSDIIANNKEVFKHCDKIRCYKFSEDISEEELKERKKRGLSFNEGDFMIVAAPVYKGRALKKQVGEIITIYRNVYPNWKKKCNLTYSYPNKIVVWEFLQNREYNYDVTENMGKDAGPCDQYYFDGFTYHKINLNQHKVIVYASEDRNVYELGLLRDSQKVYLPKNKVFFVNSYREKGLINSPVTNFSAESIFGHEQYSWKTHDFKVASNDEMIRDFLIHGQNSQYADALSHKMPIYVEYNDKSGKVLFRFSRRFESFPKLSDVESINQNCNPSKSFTGKYLTLYGIYHCTRPLVPDFEDVYVPMSAILDYSRSKDFPALATFDHVTLSYRDNFLNESGFEIYTGKIISFEVKSHGRLFDKIRKGSVLEPSELHQDVFDSCHRDYNGREYSCEVVIMLEHFANRN